MARADLPFTSAVDALAAFRSRELSPVELLDAVLAQADAVEPSINAVVHVRRDAALAAAREAEARYAGRGGGEPRPLEGLPIAVKEEQPFVGEPLEYGSLTRRGRLADGQHPIIDRIGAAGGVMHIRTATPEFSCAAFTHTRLWGVTRNPWNLDVTPGGSSGGTGAALASGEAVLGTGSDIGGSIRIPASLCGLVGYKPPYGRVPAMAPYNLDTYCQDGPLGRSVADVALLHNVISGQDLRDIVSLPFPGPIAVDGAAERVRGLRIAWARTLGDFPVDPEVAAATARTATVLADLGAQVEEVEVPVSQELLYQAAFAHYGALMGPGIEHDIAGREDQVMPYVLDFRDRADRVFREVGAYRGVELEGEISARVVAATDGFDALVCPTLFATGLAVGQDYVDTPVVIDGTEVEFYLWACATPLFNVLARRPVMAVPSGIASNGVPTGVQIVARPYDDATAFDIAAAIESVEHWWADPAWRPGLVRG
jgi:Asp-tRNA(Asn)/Glu-tRNA(Gln) amidotransferase A subunit family amidase